ncbi:MAG: prolyl oligopeptidase family serine peptidase [Candidatus Hydrogenedentes bacterium]|nr:prolyl oligopeptidase family serine peptidase [Candidatus Hydrogenedentota bacterium]
MRHLPALWAIGIVLLLSGCVTTKHRAPGDPDVSGFLNKSIEVNGKVSKYVIYVPDGYTPSKSWPLVVFLHGAGERGDDGMMQSQVGISPAIRKFPERFPAIVLMPQCPTARFWDAILEDMKAQMAATREEYNIDEKRISLTGLSMGGYGAWMWGATESDTFAALLPICGGGDLGDIAKRISADVDDRFGTLEERIPKLATLPIWAFHGAADSVVPVEQSRVMVDKVKAAGGNVKYTEYEGVDHNSWDRAYSSKEAIEWLLSQHK